MTTCNRLISANQIYYISTENLEDLECSVNDTTVVVDESSQVCGSDDTTYSSICNLIQTTSNVDIAYSGPCEADECDVGEVSSGN